MSLSSHFQHDFFPYGRDTAVLPPQRQMQHNRGPPNQQLGAHNVLQGGGWPGLTGAGPGQSGPRAELGFASLLHSHRHWTPPLRSRAERSLPQSRPRL